MREVGDLDEVRVVCVHVKYGPRYANILSSDFIDTRTDFINLLVRLGVSKVTTNARAPFRGHSYEMAVTMAALGAHGVYSGIVDTWNNDGVWFEKADGLRTKRSVIPNLITPHVLPYTQLRPTEA